jgi:uncharacterized phage-associated protein
MEIQNQEGDIMKHPFNFNIEKGIESVLYIIENGTQPTFHHVSKVLYFADKEHLERYGRFICGDSYIAMKNCPVPSGIYDLLKLARGDLSPIFYPPQEIIDSIHQAIGILGRYSIINRRKSDTEMFSESDIECLNNSIKKYGNLSFSQLTELSHDKAWESADQNDLMEIDHIIAGFDNSEDLYEHLLDPHPGGI